jgi:hypothetical protein
MAETLSTIQNDIADLERQLQTKRAALEHEKSEKEVLHEVVGDKIKVHVPAYSPATKQQTKDSVPVSPSTAVPEPPSYLSPELKEKVQALVRIVLEKNLEEGLKEAAKSDNIALIDAFHDMLVDELYDQLLAERKIQKVE